MKCWQHLCANCNLSLWLSVNISQIFYSRQAGNKAFSSARRSEFRYSRPPSVHSSRLIFVFLPCDVFGVSRNFSSRFQSSICEFIKYLKTLNTAQTENKTDIKWNLETCFSRVEDVSVDGFLLAAVTLAETIPDGNWWQRWLYGVTGTLRLALWELKLNPIVLKWWQNKTQNVRRHNRIMEKHVLFSNLVKTDPFKMWLK